MKLLFKKSFGGVLLPSSEDTEIAMQKIANGEEFLIEVKKARNIKFHKKAFALLKVVFENQERYATLEDMRVEFKLKAGLYDEHITTKGKMIYVPKSMSFESMDELEFNELYSKFIDIALKHFAIDKEFLEREILRFL